MSKTTGDLTVPGAPLPAALSADAAPRRGFSGFWWLVIGFWLFNAMVSALEMALLQSSSIRQGIDWAVIRFAPWILITPVVIWASARFTLELSNWTRFIWVHLAICILSLALIGFFAYLTPVSPLQTVTDATELHGTHPEPLDPSIPILRRVAYQLPVFWGLVGVAHALWFYERARERERRQVELESHLVQARLQALRTQLNPHFLFNTLNSIAALVHAHPKAEAMIEALSELLRLTLKGSERQEVSLREELHFLDRYLLIEQMRFGERLRVEKNIADATLVAAVPILILQPLVENAVKHGIEAQIAPGVISISACQQDDKLCVEVNDNGRGFAQGSQRKEGVGLTNTRSRLRELYGAAASLDLQPRETGGVSAKILIPWHPLPADRPNQNSSESL